MEHFSRLFILCQQLEGSTRDPSNSREGEKALCNLDRLIALYSPPAMVNNTWKVEGISKSRWERDLMGEMQAD